jgi:hypothetical protein
MLTFTVGPNVGGIKPTAEGDTVGRLEGTAEGIADGVAEGLKEGTTVSVGYMVGLPVGVPLGVEGCVVRELVGCVLTWMDRHEAL